MIALLLMLRLQMHRSTPESLKNQDRLVAFATASLRRFSNVTSSNAFGEFGLVSSQLIDYDWHLFETDRVNLAYRQQMLRAVLRALLLARCQNK